MSRWPLRMRLAQLLMVGVDPRQPGAAAEIVRSTGVGGVFVGGNDTSLIRSGTLHSLAGPGQVAPLVAVDEEGGRVQRVDGLFGPVPSARVMAATLSPQGVQALANRRGQQLRGLGITVDFAPDADVSAQPDKAVIGDRSFSSEAATVVRYSRAFADGLRAANVLPVFKHFPGHGHSGDSHAGIVSTPALDQLRGADLIPFEHLPSPAGVMVGHLLVPGLTGAVPASLSSAAINGLLRHDLGFGGIVFTDELGGMKAVTTRFGIGDAVPMALAAGADMALWGDDGGTTPSARAVNQMLDRLESTVNAGRLSEAAVNASVTRVLEAKGSTACPSG